MSVSYIFSPMFHL
ncbi:hypothetical protein M8C21_024797 [Ambrosia artemisiifolia]|uniref:Uncharacterized protein n=1 Tax=Ambrosia artemisiifolia TaxID=4212 RepID=A0AAD5D8W3_AMBAR|nr:hypothetical protein M8C21_024797 [Ambrosia artemisiifolia]